MRLGRIKRHPEAGLTSVHLEHVYKLSNYGNYSNINLQLSSALLGRSDGQNLLPELILVISLGPLGCEV
jgi:hypothetical protein